MENVNAAGGVGRPPAAPGEMNQLVDDMAGLHLDTLPVIVERAFFFEILKETIPAYDFAWLKWAFGMAQKIPIEPGAVAYTHVPLIFQRINPPRIEPNKLKPLSTEDGRPTDNFEARINGSIKINTDEIRKILPNRIFDQTKEKNYRQIIEDIISTPLIINWEYRFNKLYLTHYNTTPLGTSCLEIRGVEENPAGAGAGAMEGGRRRKRTRTKRRKSKSKKSRRR
jgi:hypothetical protein